MTERVPTRLTTKSREQQLITLIELLAPHVERDEALEASGHDMGQIIKVDRATRATTMNLSQRMLFVALQELEELTAGR